VDGGGPAPGSRAHDGRSPTTQVGRLLEGQVVRPRHQHGVSSLGADLGHADPITTLAVYASAPASRDRVAAEAIGERFFGPESQEAQEPEIIIRSRKISAPLPRQSFRGLGRSGIPSR